MSGRADQWIRWTTTACVGLLALIAGIVSYLHMHMLVALHGQPGGVAVLTPLSVDGMIVAASTTLLSDSRSGSRGGVLPWALLVVGSVASLAANVAVAEPTVTGRVIAAWPSFALIAHTSSSCAKSATAPHVVWLLRADDLDRNRPGMRRPHQHNPQTGIIRQGRPGNARAPRPWICSGQRGSGHR